MEGEKPAWEEDDKVLDDFDISWNVDNQDDDNKGGDDAQATSGVQGLFSNLLSPNRPLTKTDLEPPLKQMQQLATHSVRCVTTSVASYCNVSVIAITYRASTKSTAMDPMTYRPANKIRTKPRCVAII